MRKDFLSDRFCYCVVVSTNPLDHIVLSQSGKAPLYLIFGLFSLKCRVWTTFYIIYLVFSPVHTFHASLHLCVCVTSGCVSCLPGTVVSTPTWSAGAPIGPDTSAAIHARRRTHSCEQTWHTAPSAVTHKRSSVVIKSVPNTSIHGVGGAWHTHTQPTSVTSRACPPGRTLALVGRHAAPSVQARQDADSC